MSFTKFRTTSSLLSSWPASRLDCLYLVPLKTQVIYPVKLPHLQVTEYHMGVILLQMKSIFHISSTNQALSESIRTNVSQLAGDKRPILYPLVSLP